MTRKSQIGDAGIAALLAEQTPTDADLIAKASGLQTSKNGLNQYASNISVSSMKPTSTRIV
jgi:hypothetical protein